MNSISTSSLNTKGDWSWRSRSNGHKIKLKSYFLSSHVKIYGITHPQAKYCPSRDAASVVAFRHPSSLNLCTQLRVFMSQTYTSPSSVGRTRRNQRKTQEWQCWNRGLDTNDTRRPWIKATMSNHKTQWKTENYSVINLLYYWWIWIKKRDKTELSQTQIIN